MLRATWSNVSELRLCINELYIPYSKLMLHYYLVDSLLMLALLFIGTFETLYIHNRQIVRIVNLFVKIIVINLLVKLYSLLICSIIRVHVLVTFRTKSYKQRKVLILKRVSITTINIRYSFAHDNTVEMKREMFYICIYNNHILSHNFVLIHKHMLCFLNVPNCAQCTITGRRKIPPHCTYHVP